MIKLLKSIAPIAFNDGLKRCNDIGKKVIGKMPKGGVLLDVGCGSGELTMEFAEKLRAKKVMGIEVVDEEILEAEKKGVACIKSDLNLKWQVEDDIADVVLSSQNIEHLHNTRLYLAECKRVLKPGGKVVILTENLSSWMNVFSLVLGWQPFSTTNINGWSIGNPLAYHKDKEKDEAFTKKMTEEGLSGATGHVRVLSYFGLKDMLKRSGFKNIKMYTRGYLPLWGIISDVLCGVDRVHGHFLIAEAEKEQETVK